MSGGGGIGGGGMGWENGEVVKREDRVCSVDTQNLTCSMTNALQAG